MRRHIGTGCWSPPDPLVVERDLTLHMYNNRISEHLVYGNSAFWPDGRILGCEFPVRNSRRQDRFLYYALASMYPGPMPRGATMYVSTILCKILKKITIIQSGYSQCNWIASHLDTAPSYNCKLKYQVSRLSPVLRIFLSCHPYSSQFAFPFSHRSSICSQVCV